MTIILLNCITLGLYNPMDVKCLSKKCQVLERLETFIYVYFVLEMVVKMIAFGVFGKLGYLAESWNRLDLFIVAAGWVILFFRNSTPEVFLEKGVLKICRWKFIDVLRKRWSAKFHKNVRIAPLMGSFSNQTCNSIARDFVMCIFRNTCRRLFILLI